MITQMFGKKLKQTHMFTEDGKRIPVTVIEVPSHIVTQLKTSDKEGYVAVKVLLKDNGKKSARKTEKSREIRLEKDEQLPEINSEIQTASVFALGDKVKVSGITKGKGFQGGVKRHGFKGGPKTHGQSDRLRAPGSIGSTTTPGRVYKGKRMAGHMGTTQNTVKGLQVIEINEEKRLLIIKGLVPGYINNIVSIKKQ